MNRSMDLTEDQQQALDDAVTAATGKLMPLLLDFTAGDVRDAFLDAIHTHLWCELDYIKSGPNSGDGCVDDHVKRHRSRFLAMQRREAALAKS